MGILTRDLTGKNTTSAPARVVWGKNNRDFSIVVQGLTLSKIEAIESG